MAHLSNALIGLQMLCVAFGALVLMPLLTGLDPAVALFTAGLGTLVFQWVTGRTVPIFLASSFAFIPPTLYGIQTWGLPATLSGLGMAGVAYIVLGACIRWRGPAFLTRFLPPVVTGPVILSIGLVLCPVAANLTQGLTGDGSTVLFPRGMALSVAGVALVATVAVSLLARGLWKLLPILVGIVAGCLAASLLGMGSTGPVWNAPWFSVPAFTAPQWNWAAVLYVLPFSLAVAVEHFGDISAIGAATGKNYLVKPGLHRTYLGDGLATVLAALLGGPPNTTYSEVTGAVILTRNHNPVVLTWAAGFAIVLAFVGKLNGLLQSIPTPVMGGILLAIFGSIAVVGIRSLAGLGEALLYPRNVFVVGISLAAGLGGLEVEMGPASLTGVSLTAFLAFGLNSVLPKGKPWNVE